MMNIEPPAELQGYRQDVTAGTKARFVGRLLKWGAILSFVGMPVFGILGSPIGFLASFVACMAAALISARIFSKKRKRKCPRCRKPMEHLGDSLVDI